jgi:hypothetical protein
MASGGFGNSFLASGAKSGPVVWAKAQLLLNLAGIEDYCRKPFGGPADHIARWQDNCANVPQRDPFP